jgi:crotonobetainyl-CoA:carnitine CoA-transferase CaiB-like acyl-CoA transferase
LTPYFHHHTTAQWMQIFEEIGLPAGPVLSIAEMHADPQTLAREMLVEVEHSRVGKVKTMGLPVKFSETPGAVRHGAPVLGEHTREILLEAGYSADEIKNLVEVGAVAAL